MGFFSRVRRAVRRVVSRVRGKTSSSGKTSTSGPMSVAPSSSTPSSSSSSSSRSRSSGRGGSSSSPAGTAIASAQGGGVIRSDGKGGTYIDRTTTPTQAIRETVSSSGGKTGGAGKISSPGKISTFTKTEQALQMSLPSELRDRPVTEVTKKLNLRGTTLQQQAALRGKQSLPGQLPKGTPVGSAPGGTLVADGRGGTKFVPKSRGERQQEAFATAYEKSVEEQIRLKSGRAEREVKVQKFSDSQFNYYQNLVNQNKISVEEATRKYKQSVSAYDRDLLERSLGGATLAGMSTLQGESFSVIPSIEQAKVAKAAGKKAAKGVKFTGQDAKTLGISVLSLGPDIVKAPGKAGKTLGQDIRSFGKEAKRIAKSPQSFPEGKLMEIAGIWESTKTSRSLRGFVEGATPKTGKELAILAGTFAIGAGTGVVFKGVGAVAKAAAGARAAKIASALGWGFAGVAGTAYAYEVREEVRFAQTPEEKGKVFGKTAQQVAAFGGGMFAGSKLTGKAIAGLTPRVYSDPLMVDVKVSKPVSKTGLPKQRDIFTDPGTGKTFILDRGLPVKMLSELGVPGRQPRFSTPFREALGLQPKFVGGTARSNSAAYKKALKSLKKQGYTDYQAREALKLRRPQYQRTTLEGEMTLVQVGEQPLQRLMSGTQVTEFMPGQKGGVKFLKRKPISKKISEEAAALGEEGIRFELLEQNLARPLGKQTETFAGVGKGRKIGEAEAVDVILSSRQQEIFRVSKNQLFDIFETTTIARKTIPSQRKILGGKGIALVERGEPPITITDLSVSPARGFKGGGRKSSPEFIKQLYMEQPQSLKLSKTTKYDGRLEGSKINTLGAVSKLISGSDIRSRSGDSILRSVLGGVNRQRQTPKRSGKITQPKRLKSPEAVSSYGRVNSILLGSVSGAYVGSDSSFISDFTRGLEAWAPTKKTQATTEDTVRQAPTQEGLGKLPTYILSHGSVGILPTYSLKSQIGKLPTFSLNLQTLEPLRELSLSKEDIKTRSRSRSNLAATFGLITLQRQPQVLKQPQIIRQQTKQQQRFFQLQAQMFTPISRFPTTRQPRYPRSRRPPIMPLGVFFTLPDVYQGPRGEKRGRSVRRPESLTRYTQTLSNIILFGVKAVRLPRQRKFSGLEIRPAIVLPQIAPGVPQRDSGKRSSKKRVIVNIPNILDPLRF